MEKMYRQGDLLFRKIDKVPSEAKLRKDDVILRGEASGHKHRIVNGQIYETIQKNYIQPDSVTMYIIAKKGARVIHEEHAPIELEIGIYIVIRQREFDGQEERMVMD